MNHAEPSLKNYAFSTPLEMKGLTRKHPVVIVGAGPIGLTLALTLRKAGVECVLLEDDHRVCDGSRAIGMSRRTLEIWDAVGAIDEIKAKGLDWTGGRSFYKEKEILQFEMADDPQLMYRPMFNIQQSYTEQFLVNEVLKSPGIDLRWESRLQTLEVQKEGVALGIQTPQGDYSLEASYLVACDGAKSTVRSLMDLHLQGTSYEATYLIVDVHLKTSAKIERRCWFDSPSNPGLTVLMHGQPDDVWRLDFQLPEQGDLSEMLKEEHIRSKIQAHLDFIGEHGPWELVWFSPYKVHSRSLDSFTHGRVLFAGDAAHLMPIFGIRGLNSGVEDAWNLAWKLADVFHGKGHALLLEAYSMERRKVFLENTALANRNAMFMTPPNAGIHVLRDAVLSLALGQTPVADILNPKQATYVPLRGSPLGTEDDVPWSRGPEVGEVVPGLILQASEGESPVSKAHSKTHLQQWLALKPTLMCFLIEEPSEVQCSALKQLQDELDLQVLLVSKTPMKQVQFQCLVQEALHERFGAEDGGFYLIRNDHHIAARWKTFQYASIKRALERLKGNTLQGKSLVQDDTIPVPYTSAEQIYQSLGEALDGLSQDAKMLMLMKLCLVQALEKPDVQAFQGHLAVALKDMDL